ncbi:nucleoside recognition domain-containing protein [Geothermobacter hydrogeniphilus]|uniref:Nucleoside transporter/FeoB GTPase Gate domain-containing protein n=1 Tax=Geothermobacter hydrogeniphilus TaxID=1969733 RepID=A0A1X0Y098_9BACT|nr:nucleoside recognition domain-containing protein [Geothermobacter hydrogeniphilus]ORJ58573.1 hypothetical protein B5V00_12045 [Geothermobacter hydrogeniphilus]
MKKFVEALKTLLQESGSLYLELLKVMVPVMILVRLAVELGAIDLVGKIVAPVMSLVGLPGEMGFVWVTAMLVNIYAAAAALLTLLPTVPLSIAQATVLGAMILIAHSLPVEQRIAQKAGAGFLFTLVLRLAAALVYGALLNLAYAGFAGMQEPARVIFLHLTPPAADWGTWALASLSSLWSIFWIITVLLAGLKVLERTGVTPLLARALSPLLRLMGIGTMATSMTVTGSLLGISYGGALIIQEARSGRLAARDVFLSLCFMCLCHSLIEDTLFVMAFGGHWSGLLIGRFLFALLVTMLLAQGVRRLSGGTVERFLFGKGQRSVRT